MKIIHNKSDVSFFPSQKFLFQTMDTPPAGGGKIVTEGPKTLTGKVYEKRDGRVDEEVDAKVRTGQSALAIGEQANPKNIETELPKGLPIDEFLKQNPSIDADLFRETVDSKRFVTTQPVLFKWNGKNIECYGIPSYSKNERIELIGTIAPNDIFWIKLHRYQHSVMRPYFAGINPDDPADVKERKDKEFDKRAVDVMFSLYKLAFDPDIVAWKNSFPRGSDDYAKVDVIQSLIPDALAKLGLSVPEQDFVFTKEEEGKVARLNLTTERTLPDGTKDRQLFELKLVNGSIEQSTLALKEGFGVKGFLGRFFGLAGPFSLDVMLDPVKFDKLAENLPSGWLS